MSNRIARVRTLRIALSLSAAVTAVSCADVTGPEPIYDPHQAATFAKGSESGDGNRFVHANKVRLSNMVFGATVVDLYSIKAHDNPHGTKGHFDFYQERIVEGLVTAVVIASGEIDCLAITANKAKVGGTVTWTSFPEGIPVGSEITWSMTDNGQPAHSPDLASQPLGNNAQSYCALGLPYAESPVLKGKVQVHP
jgi:hypothetical protein